MKKILIAAMMLVGCVEEDASDISERMYPGLSCFGHKDYGLCINYKSEPFVCFGSQSANIAFCLRAVPFSELTKVEK